MINREWQKVQVISFNDGIDAYGQKRRNGQTSREVEMVLKIYNQANVNTVNYVDVDMVGLTADKEITDANQIKIDEQLYNVKYSIPSGRLHQIFMKKV